MSHKLNHTDVNFLNKGVVMVTIIWYLCITTKLVNSISPPTNLFLNQLDVINFVNDLC